MSNSKLAAFYFFGFIAADLLPSMVTSAQAVALSVAFGVVVALSSIPGAVFWMTRVHAQIRSAEVEHS
jgi:hypothetical protein